MNRLLVLAVFCSFLPASVDAGTVLIPGISGGEYAVRVTSHKEALFRTTARQQYDFSCGSAALATLLTYHYEDPVSEQQVFKEMFEAGDRDKIREHGFSLLDIKRYLQNRGYVADGYRVPLDKLAEYGVPAIVLISQEGYRHFVVVKGVTADAVLTGDPSWGLRKLDRREFETMWNGLVFLIRNKKLVANRYFGNQEEWNYRARAPMRAALKNSDLANVTWLLPGPNDI